MEKVKQSFLRACINHGTMDMELLENILQPLCEHHNVDKPDVQTLVESINEGISANGQTLALQKFTLTGQELLVFAMTREAQGSKHHPTLTDEECKYFSDLLHKIVQAANYGIEWHQAFAIPPGSTKPLTKKHMEELLETWKQQGYFYEKRDDDKLYFGPRTIIEFGFHLSRNYAEHLQECPLCKRLTFWDINCENCKIRIHKDCIRKYIRTRSNCPACERPWTTRLSQSGN